MQTAVLVPVLIRPPALAPSPAYKLPFTPARVADAAQAWESLCAIVRPKLLEELCPTGSLSSDHSVNFIKSYQNWS